MTLIIIVTIIMFLVLIGWTWSNLASIDRNKKIGYILASIAIMMIVTLIIFSISKIGINYENENMVGPVRILLVAVFTSLNGFVVIQYIARILGRTYEQTIEKEEANKKIAIILIIFIIIAIIECLYMKNIQNGILDMMNNLKNSHL